MAILFLPYFYILSLLIFICFRHIITIPSCTSVFCFSYQSGWFNWVRRRNNTPRDPVQQHLRRRQADVQNQDDNENDSENDGVSRKSGYNMRGLLLM